METFKNIPRMIWIGQISSYFALIILVLRHYLVFPSNHFWYIVIILLIGFSPSSIYKIFDRRYTSWILVINALFIVSLVFGFMKEWALSGAFLLIPVYALLFRDKKVYILSSICSAVLMVGLLYYTLRDNTAFGENAVIMIDMCTVFFILLFIIYFIIEDLRVKYTTEAKHVQAIRALTQSVEARDEYTRGHSERVAYLGEWIAKKLKGIDARAVFNSGLVHDVGKLSIPDSVLLKTSHLTPEEYDIMKTHPELGASMCVNLELNQEIVSGVLEHHERWDGGGYPSGLKGNHIFIFGRILCLADSIDAMCSNRAYRKALDMEVVQKEIYECKGKQFDPDISDAVLENWDEFQEYYLDLRNKIF